MSNGQQIKKLHKKQRNSISRSNWIRNYFSTSKFLYSTSNSASPGLYTSISTKLPFPHQSISWLSNRLIIKFYEERLATLTSWSHKTSRSEQLATAGFQYSEHSLCSDGVKCIACGQEATEWESDDNPFVEHIRLSSSCSFIRSIQVDEA